MLPSGGLENGTEQQNEDTADSFGKQNRKFEKIISATMAGLHEKSRDDMKEMIESAMTMFAEKSKNAATDANNVLNTLANAEECKRKLEAEAETCSENEKHKKQRLKAKLDAKIDELHELL